MYLPDDQIEFNALRQGDLISQVHMLGVINPQAIHYSSDYQGNKTGWEIRKAPDICDAMVLSHSCEIARDNSEVKLTSIILAPIRQVSSATKDEKIQSLIDSNIITTETTHSFLKYFYLHPNSKLVISDGAVVDFSKCFSMRKQAYEALLKNKVGQLTSEYRDHMARKLALYFYRRTEYAA